MEDASACLAGVITSTTAQTVPTNESAVRENVTFTLFGTAVANGNSISSVFPKFSAVKDEPSKPKIFYVFQTFFLFQNVKQIELCAEIMEPVP